MPLPPLGKNRRRTEALFGDISPAVDTQAIPVPLQALEQAKKAAQPRSAGQPGHSSQPGGPQQSGRAAQPAQFAQPPRTRPAANPLDSGPIATAAAARTAAGMRAGRPASRPIGDPAPQAPGHPGADFGQGPAQGQWPGQGAGSGPGQGQNPGSAFGTGSSSGTGFGQGQNTAASFGQGQNTAAGFGPDQDAAAGFAQGQGETAGYGRGGQGYGEDTTRDFGQSAGQGFGSDRNQRFGPALGYGPGQAESNSPSPERIPTARPVVPGAPPSLFASPSSSAGDAPGGELASPHEAGQHAGMGSERAAGPGRHRGPAEGRASAAANSRLPWEEGWSPNPHSVGPPSALESSGPFSIVIPPEAPPKDQSRKVLVGVLIVFAVLLLVAAWSLRGLFTGSDDSAAGPREQGPVLTTAPIASKTQEEAAQTEAPVAPSPTEEPVVVEIEAVTAIDPLGDGDERSAGAARAVDGDEDTFWESERYQSAAFGGLKKGLGLAIELRRTTAVSSAEIDVAGTGGRVQLRTADEPEFEGSTSIGSGSFENGTVTVDAKEDADAGKYVILWFTELPAVESGYRMEVSEVRLT
ncbi:hypothetical protein LWF15_15155 [Kineosporia rhizophila]|uniref:hypothetical protein n=1 Tax=Kineosporia rhizophila TaxID=84633 RepID=UPI001E4B1B92|nr:hypothetical protein [Kineosporia rhizophila]MCE0536842.1 hypothetical protein [Kineosporia rhizophila]